MIEAGPDNDDAPRGGESLLEALRGVAGDASTRETLRELGDRARGIVEELARNARTRAAAAGVRTGAEPGAAPQERGAAQGAGASTLPPDLHHRLADLQGCVAEVIDTLEATAERLETIEAQLGDPDSSIEALLAGGIQRCERLLMGIEHRVGLAVAVDAAVTAAGEGAEASKGPLVLVVSASSAERAALCVGLEKQGLRCAAAVDFVGAQRSAARFRPSVLLLAPGIEDTPEAGMLDDWKEAEEQGTLPRVTLAGSERATALRDGAFAFGFPFVALEHGPAAMAACLLDAAAAAGGGPPSECNTQER